MISVVSFLVAKVYSKLKEKENLNAHTNRKPNINEKSENISSQIRNEQSLHLKIMHNFLADSRTV